MLVYLDSSALIKRAIREPGSEAFVLALGAEQARGSQLVSASLAWVEVSRALRSRLDDADPVVIARLTEVALSGIDEAPQASEVVSVARRIGPPALRSLDSIHLATATLLDADEIWSYDLRLVQVADELGFTTRAPA
ncbi:type II toxin-antitoxin system VapC family toxin [Agromyces larvae]|uniref:Ribonuclease VapC n=1 Tax=Agromyces larvae TaxID=2929802 RepID=A0ABY4BW73_9MICO|nr:type II toxin-antitoxin system VapC family toxin [Agromyces larvae]UOE43447.1 type II toxin-antitoxin system VapC family toxin [Agromyces larvae]